MTSLCISVGNNAIARGICCIAIGDNVTARGAFQVVIGKEVSLPSDIATDKLDELIENINDMKLTFEAMVNQRQAPKDFAKQSAAAIDMLVGKLKAIKDKEPSLFNHEDVTSPIAVDTPATPPSTTPPINSDKQEVPTPSTMESVS
jgi:hypothetical protein